MPEEVLSERRTALKRPVIEAAVIVGSILLAFAIDAAWDRHQEQQVREDLLRGIELEF